MNIANRDIRISLAPISVAITLVPNTLEIIKASHEKRKGVDSFAVILRRPIMIPIITKVKVTAEASILTRSNPLSIPATKARIIPRRKAKPPIKLPRLFFAILFFISTSFHSLNYKLLWINKAHYYCY